ncbi:hypothetical protein OG393_33010 (plasmid) [Streptomyces sp. NBC_01216]|uniref:hypothetical protein n=1 Tax=Streptomyces sp. NBC_01216 TaxID=2903778 RepID=UPI002E0F4D9D|nr:hypothetical protein OG393_33010 [Streptomyces sp. NBC_01216]
MTRPPLPPPPSAHHPPALLRQPQHRDPELGRVLLHTSFFRRFPSVGSASRSRSTTALREDQLL